MQGAAVADPTANSHWSSQEWLATETQNGEPNCDWLMSVWWADSGKAWLRGAAAGWVGSAAGAAG